MKLKSSSGNNSPKRSNLNTSYQKNVFNLNTPFDSEINFPNI